MNDLELLKQIPGRIEPLDGETRDRLRAALSDETGKRSKVSVTSRARRRRVRIGVIAIAAVLAGTAATMITRGVWTTDQPVAIPLGDDLHFTGSYLDIPDPDGNVDPTTLPSTVAEFAPAVRLPDGGSFDQWEGHQIRSYRPDYWYETDRSTVAEGMVRASECQWVQQWLSATAASKDADAAQALRILPGIVDWLHAAGSSVNGYIDDPLLGQMRRGDVVQVQSFSNGQCAFTGSWGATASAQDAKAAADLVPAIQVVRSWLDDGGEPTAFGSREGDNATPLIMWTDVVVQPAPLFPGSIYIAPTTEDGVMLVSTSESGSRYCAVIGYAGVERGIVDPQRYPPDPTSINTPWDKYPGPVGCSPGEWPAGLSGGASS
jgi:hypothetical protein